MKIIPVIDILNGIAVHGIRGERKQYQPLKSLLFNSVDPTEIAVAFESLGFSNLYLADLDAIQSKSINYQIYNQITARTCLDLMVDAGITNNNLAEKMFATGVTRIVIGTETLNRLDFVDQAVSTFGEDKIVVSIDQKGGELLSVSHDIASMDIISAAQKLANLGAQQIILLDLDRVGTEHGVNNTVLKTILDTTTIEVMAGGGIRSLQELEQLRRLGVSSTLVATVLHNGKLTVSKLKAAGFL